MHASSLLTLCILVIAALLKPLLHKPTPITVPQQVPMCHTTAQEMADFAGDPRFRAAHHTPMPPGKHIQFKGKNITFKVADGPKGNAYLIKSKRKSDKWLFVYQEWWGLNDNIRNQADKFYESLQGRVNVMAIDMYDGRVTNDRSEAAALMQGVSETRLESLVRGAQMRAGAKAKIASVGWCFGGGWALKSALITGSQSVGSVMYYGMPVRDVEKLKTLQTDVLGIFATEDWISKEIIEDFAEKMKEANKTLTYKIFPNPHAFANPSNPKYDPAAADEAFRMAMSYLEQKFSL